MSRTATAFSIGFREQARNYVLPGLLVVLPFAFITLAFAVTQDVQMPVRTLVDCEVVALPRAMPDVHGVVMTPITSALIAGLAGLFLMREARDTDGRLSVVGYRAWEVIAVRFGVLATLTVVGAALNRLAGMWLILILPMLDIGLFQEPLFVQSSPDWWMKLLPGYHPVRVMVDSGLTAGVDTAASFGWSLIYLALVAVCTIFVYYRETRRHRG